MVSGLADLCVPRPLLCGYAHVIRYGQPAAQMAMSKQSRHRRMLAGRLILRWRWKRFVIQQGHA